jgi:dihydrolipoamide dehydrogenase
VIIGGGPGGYAAALYGASAGLDVALIERNKVGGTCLNVGCIPAKELLETAAVRRAVAGATDFGIEGIDEPTVDMAVTQQRKQAIVDKLVGGLGTLLKHRKVTVLDGVGRLGSGRTVTVSGGSSGDVELSGDAVVLATGSVPRTIPGFEVDGEVVLTSDEFLSLDRVPDTAAVIGGGAIGCEFASTWADLGAEVTILEALPKILPGCDADITRQVERSFKQRGITIRTGVSIEGHEPRPGGTRLQLEGGDTLEVDAVVVSVGRSPLTDGLGLDGTEVSTDERGFVVADAHGRTGEEAVWAVGDVVATPALAHVAFIEGMNAIRDILGEDPPPVDYERVPWCIYCHPEVAFVGHSEQSARDAGLEVVTSKHRFGGNGRAMILGDAEGLVKVIAERGADGEAGRLLGVHMVGPWVTEQLGQAYLSVNWEAEVGDLAPLIQAHPTLSETFGEAVMALTGRSLH